ncbi:MAG: 50S ribosomal protein L5 [Candidatus Aenigmatarchaeota archaeon]
MEENPMREIRLEKVTINIGAGEAGPKLEKAKTLLEKIIGKKVVITKTKKRTTFGMAKGRPIGVKVTLRGKEAMEWLKRFLQANDNKLSATQFDAGNFSFGVKEYVHIPGVRYIPEIGLLGMDVCVTLKRPGFRIKMRKIKKKKIGKRHMITKEDTINWVKTNLGVRIV